jgi:hypothetical protein
MVRADTSFHPDQTRWHIGKPNIDLPPRPLLAQHDRSSLIETNDVERVLADIDADYGNCNLCWRRHGVLLVWAPLASLSLVGQEHGRTIPLADSDRLGRQPPGL